MIDLDKLEELEKKAVSAPWEYMECGIDYGYVGPGLQSTVLFGENAEGAVSQDNEDAIFLVALRNAFPSLLRELRALRAMREKIQYTRPYYYPVSDGLSSPSDYVGSSNEGWFKWRDGIIQELENNLK